MLNIELAGYNVDSVVLENLKEREWDKKENITPETLSAAYARISRDERPVAELRAEARDALDKARKSNEAIIFRMGHHSVAEHACLNFDITGLSRLAVESLEESRLSSYTEKSQRYITLEGDTVIPAEFSETDREIFKSACGRQVEAYKKLFPALHEYRKKSDPGMLMTKQGQNVVEGWAKEDARYVLSLATECQLGFTVNARNLEYIIRKLKYHPLQEVRDLSSALYERSKPVVPSLIILTDPEAFKKQTGADVSDGILKTGRKTLRSLSEKYLNTGRAFAPVPRQGEQVSLLEHTPQPDSKIIAGLLHSSSNRSWSECLSAAQTMDKSRREIFFKEIFRDLGEHDALYREFENVNFLFEIILSSSAFAQMKRHRMMTIIKQPYETSLGITLPPAIEQAGMTGVFNGIIRQTEAVYENLKGKYGEAADYLLTNAHRRRIIVSVNLREIYHIARLRMDKHAQWDIRDVASGLVGAVKKASPLAAALACGKDEFEETRKDYYINP
jgi:flavin-dependent thymidylate synthase